MATVNSDRRQIQVNTAQGAALRDLQRDSSPPPVDITKTLEEYKQNAMQATQAARQRTTADQEITRQQVPPMGRRRSLSRANRPRISLNNLKSSNPFDPLNEAGALAPSQQSAANTTQNTTQTMQSQSQHIPSKPRVLGTFESSFVEEAPPREDESQNNHQNGGNNSEDEETNFRLDDTLLNVTKDYELNINGPVTDALRSKSNHHVPELEQFTALDADDLITRVTSEPQAWYRAIVALQMGHSNLQQHSNDLIRNHEQALSTVDELSAEMAELEDEVEDLQIKNEGLAGAADRRKIRLNECEKIITQQQNTLALQQANITDLQEQLRQLNQQLQHNSQRGRDRTRTRTPQNRTSSRARDKSWSPSQLRQAEPNRYQERHDQERHDTPPARPSEAPSGRTQHTTSSLSSRPLQVPDPPEFDNKRLRRQVRTV
ncbi:hypothetical protein KCU71_g8256, partial [Aureobasidium melanogenum]